MGLFDWLFGNRQDRQFSNLLKNNPEATPADLYSAIYGQRQGDIELAPDPMGAQRAALKKVFGGKATEPIENSLNGLRRAIR